MRRLATLLTGAALAMLVTVSSADAQRRGGGGIQFGIGSGGYGGYGPGMYGGRYGSGYGNYNQPGIGLNFRNGQVQPYFNPGYGNNNGYYNNGYYNNGYYGQRGMYNNRYSNGGYYNGGYVSNGWVPNQNQISTTPDEVRPVTGGPAVDMDDRAMILVRVPANAIVKFNGEPTVQLGSIRRFHSPKLEPGWDYSLNVEATWQENGQQVRRQRKIVFQPNETLQVDLMQPQTASHQNNRPDENTATQSTNPNQADRNNPTPADRDNDTPNSDRATPNPATPRPADSTPATPNNPQDRLTPPVPNTETNPGSIPPSPPIPDQDD